MALGQSYLPICQSAFKIDPVFAHKTDPSKAVL